MHYRKKGHDVGYRKTSSEARAASYKAAYSTTISEIRQSGQFRFSIAKLCLIIPLCFVTGYGMQYFACLYMRENGILIDIDRFIQGHIPAPKIEEPDTTNNNRNT